MALIPVITGAVDAIVGVFKEKTPSQYSTDPRKAGMTLLSPSRQWPKTWENQGTEIIRLSDSVTALSIYPQGTINQANDGKITGLRRFTVAQPTNSLIPAAVPGGYSPVPGAGADIPMPIPGAVAATGKNADTLEIPKMAFFGVVGLIVVGAIWGKS